MPSPQRSNPAALGADNHLLMPAPMWPSAICRIFLLVRWAGLSSRSVRRKTRLRLSRSSFATSSVAPVLRHRAINRLGWRGAQLESADDESPVLRNSAEPTARTRSRGCRPQIPAATSWASARCSRRRWSRAQVPASLRQPSRAQSSDRFPSLYPPGPVRNKPVELTPWDRTHYQRAHSGRLIVSVCRQRRSRSSWT